MKNSDRDHIFVRTSLIPSLEDTADLIQNLVRSYNNGELDEKDLTAEVFLIGKALLGWNDNGRPEDQLAILQAKNLAVMNYLQDKTVANAKKTARTASIS